MRGLRSFLILLVVGLGLGAYLYFVESKRDPSSGDKKDKVFAIEADKIDELTVKAESGDQTSIKKSGSNWQVVQPIATGSDSAAVSGITSNLSTLEISRVIDENPSDLAEYGLAQPRIEVTFKSGGQERKLQIGRKTPPATDLYAKLGDSKRVFLVPSFVEATFNKTTFDLRDKTVPQARSRQDRHLGDLDAQPGRDVRQDHRRVADDGAGARSRRLQHRRRSRQSLEHLADEVDRHRHRRQAGRVRVRQAGGER